MTGMQRQQIVQMLIVQALSYSLISWVLGLVASGIVTRLVLGYMEQEVEVPVTKELTFGPSRSF